MGEECIQVLVGKSKGKGPRHRSENKSKMYLIEMGFQGGRSWTHLAEDRDQWQALKNMVMNLWIPYNSGNYFSG
jgi:hypothetical protein